jgi:hypothetical protein
MKLVTYDLNTPGQNYPDLHETIESLGEWRKPMESTWLIKTSWSSDRISQLLQKHIDKNDRLLVLDFDPSAATGWLLTEDIAWIQSRKS